MPAEIKRVAYSYSSALEDMGQPPYFLDVLVVRDKVALVDRHSSFKSKDELYQAMEEVIPILEEVSTHEGREDGAQDEIRAGRGEGQTLCQRGEAGQF